MGVGVVGTLMAGWASAQQVLAARRHAHGGAAAGVRAAVRAGRGIGRDGGRHAVADRHRRGWQPWWLLWQVAGAVVFFIAGAGRAAPTAVRHAGGRLRDRLRAYTEYTGLRFAFFLLAEYAGIVLLVRADRRAVPRRVAGPVRRHARAGVDAAKTFALAFVVIWFRVAYPRLREDQLQRLAWQCAGAARAAPAGADRRGRARVTTLPSITFTMLGDGSPGTRAW